MTDEANGRTITLMLQGGHVIKLNGVGDIEEFVQYLQHPTGELIHIQTELADRLVIRDNALLGIFETANARSQTSNRTHVLIENFLPPEDHQRVISKALLAEASFEPSKVTTGRYDYRKSVLISEDSDIGPMFRRSIRRVAFAAAQSLGLDLIREPQDSQIECQITAHRDGGFFHAHNDSGSPSTSTRVLSYVYYFRARPNGFFGGELKLYNSRVENGVDLIGNDFHLISPKDNSIVFFPSATWHEVLPTYVPSRVFCDSRFTVNGWVRLAPP
jgi:SM-20-related protein